MFTSEEKNKIRKFITSDLRPSYLLFKDKNEHPDKYALQRKESFSTTKKNNVFSNYIEQFKDGFVK